MNTIILPRDEQTPLKIVGEMIGEADTQLSAGGMKNKRWTEARIYKTKDGGYAVAVAGRSLVRGETTRNWAAVAPTPAILASLIMQRYGVIHLAVQNAMTEAGIWEATAECADTIIVETLPVYEQDQGLDDCVVFRDDHSQFVVGTRKSDSKPIMYCEIESPLNVAQLESVAMTMFKGIEEARKRDGSF